MITNSIMHGIGSVTNMAVYSAITNPANWYATNSFKSTYITNIFSMTNWNAYPVKWYQAQVSIWWIALAVVATALATYLALAVIRNKW